MCQSSARCLQEPDQDGDDDAVTAADEPGGFVRGGVTYRPGDCVYVTPDTFECLEDDEEPKAEVRRFPSINSGHAYPCGMSA